jgi:hypothetical protein
MLPCSLLYSYSCTAVPVLVVLQLESSTGTSTAGHCRAVAWIVSERLGQHRAEQRREICLQLDPYSCTRIAYYGTSSMYGRDRPYAAEALSADP